MTPSKETKPLPCSSANMTVALDQPTTHLQWQTALQQVKVLYLKRQYKQCASRCTQLLTTTNTEKILPLHKPFLHFYSALSHEALARSTRHLSAAKTSTLHLARDSYEAAAASLPRPLHPSITDDSDEDVADDSSTLSFSDTASSYSATSSTIPDDDDDDGDDDTSTSYQRPSHQLTHIQPPSRPLPLPPSSHTITDPLKPSPLHIRKTKPLPSPQPPTPPRPQRTLSSPLPTHAAYGYNTHLVAFATMLQTHIHAVDALLHDPSEAHSRGRHNGGAYADGEGKVEDEERRARIDRLKARGWRRRRFVPERYEELCARALADL